MSDNKVKQSPHRTTPEDRISKEVEEVNGEEVDKIKVEDHTEVRTIKETTEVIIRKPPH